MSRRIRSTLRQQIGALAVFDKLCEDPAQLSKLRRQVPFSVSDAYIGEAGPVKAVEEYLDLESVRLRIADELNQRIMRGQKRTVQRLHQLEAGSRVAYVVLRSNGARAKCYFDVLRCEFVGAIVLPETDS
jgi:hypothetical protein